MTANLTVPADVWGCNQPGVPLVAAIVEGEYVPCPMCNDTGMGRHGDGFCHSCPMDPEPPAWLVALRDARCETCGGEGHLEGRNIASWDGCFACDATGRLLHDVRVETDRIRCSACGLLRLPWDSDCKCAWNSDGAPPLGFRTVRCLVDVVPVVGELDPQGREYSTMLVPTGWDDDSVRIGDDWDGFERLTPAHVDALAAACGKPPADWVGGYAVILITTDQEAE